MLRGTRVQFIFFKKKCYGIFVTSYNLIYKSMGKNSSNCFFSSSADNAVIKYT